MLPYFAEKNHGDFDKEFIDSVGSSGYSYYCKNIIIPIHEHEI